MVANSNLFPTEGSKAYLKFLNRVTVTFVPCLVRAMKAEKDVFFFKMEDAFDVAKLQIFLSNAQTTLPVGESSSSVNLLLQVRDVKFRHINIDFLLSQLVLHLLIFALSNNNMFVNGKHFFFLSPFEGLLRFKLLDQSNIDVKPNLQKR